MDPRVLEYGNFDYQKLRIENEGSFFLNPVFDSAILGINFLTKSIIYSFEEIFGLEVELRYDNEFEDDHMFTDEDSENVKETIINGFINYQKMADAVPPTLFQEC